MHRRTFLHAAGFAALTGLGLPASLEAAPRHRRRRKHCHCCRHRHRRHHHHLTGPRIAIAELIAMLRARPKK
jgi:hypothetical protein